MDSGKFLEALSNGMDMIKETTADGRAAAEVLVALTTFFSTAACETSMP